MRFEVVIPPEITPTELGICVVEGTHLLGVLCPSCKTGRLSYRTFKDPEMNCSTVGCGAVFHKFTGISTEELSWHGPMFQVLEYTNAGIIKWIEAWTGLRGVELKIEGRK